MGIDFGTAWSAVCVLSEGRPVPVRGAEGSTATASVVAFTDGGGVLVGEAALRQAAANPHRTFRAVKRRLGTDWRAQVDGRFYSAPQIAAVLLRKLKQDAEAFAGEAVSGAVLTVPVGFGPAQRRALREAAELAGLEVLRLVHESSCIALAYAAERLVEGESRDGVVVRLGAGGFDATAVDLDRDGVFIRRVRGDARLGGDDWDQAVADNLAEGCRQRWGVDVGGGDAAAVQRLREAAERARSALSASSATSVHLPYLATGPDGPVHLEETLTRARFEELTAPLRQRATALLRELATDLDVTAPEVNLVLLAGGAARMPAVQDAVRQVFRGRPLRVLDGHEAAAGAALQAGIITGARRDLVLVDSVFGRVGVEVQGGEAVWLIEHDALRPTRGSNTFVTAEPLRQDGSRPVAVTIHEAGSSSTSPRQRLGTLLLDGLRVPASGPARIEVALEVDYAGEVLAVATDVASGRQWRMDLRPPLAPAPVNPVALVAEEPASDPAPAAEDQRRSNSSGSAPRSAASTAPSSGHSGVPKIELRAGLPGWTEEQAVDLLRSGKARIHPDDVTAATTAEGCLLGIGRAAGFLMTGTGVMAWAHPQNNVGSPFLLLPGLVLFFSDVWCKPTLIRRAVARLARAPRRPEP
ncbi:Hsp70 family protein [Kitasatospora sp. NPDC048194]|uniref:Hsp70 family protein n=1 Tax=Kitasatospora sp. NPDC048194 TaxID=3364045 RepID=UPI0037173E1F